MVLTEAHIHLILNHVPIVGVAFVSLLLSIGLIFRNTFTQKVSLLFLVLIAAVTAIVYLSGDGAARAVQGLPGVTTDLIRAHESIARIALVITGFLGALAFFGLALYWKRDKLPALFISGVLLVSLVTTGIMVWTGLLGGEIRHTEIRPGAHVVQPFVPQNQ
jgi:uncharacterized membrane protein